MNKSDLILEMKGISKTFPGVKALENVHIDLKKGEVLSVLGENGAGKSTLIKILGGIHQADDGGEIFIEGKRVDIRDVQTASELGVSVIHQELFLVDHMTVTDNIMLGREKIRNRLHMVDKAASDAFAQKTLDELHLDIPCNELVKNLTIAQQQMIEIAKALSKDAKIIVMDEPTSSLSDKETVVLFDFIRKLKAKGVAIIYISHRMEELFEISDRITVLRDGQYIGTKITKETNVDDLIQMMIGRELKDMYAMPKLKAGEVIMEVENLSTDYVQDVSFKLRKGEILGFYGLVGAGRTEVLRGIFGIDQVHSGKIILEGQEVTINSPKQATELGLAFVPEDRKIQGAVLHQSVGYNITLCILDKVVQLFKNKKSSEKKIVDDYIKRLRIKTPSAEQHVANLSGGNQQKVVIAKWLATNPKILFLDEPTRGIDVGAKKEIYTLMTELIDAGLTIIMVSSDMSELRNMSTRVMTMYSGTINGELDGSEITEENILLNVTGGA